MLTGVRSRPRETTYRSTPCLTTPPNVLAGSVVPDDQRFHAYPARTREPKFTSSDILRYGYLLTFGVEMGLVAGLQPEDPREIGPYRLLGKLGSGGMGHVFLGMSAGGRPIAVKVIREELADDPQFRTRFRGEVAAARKVSGLFTAYVVDADLDGAVPWLATSYVAGPSLTDAVREHGPLPTQTLLALAAGLAEGLSAIHAAGVVHRDLKPSNVLLAEDGPRVIDFGISEAAEASALTGANVVIGSPGFLSPEQILGQDVGPPGDIFSLGAVLTFAGTGQGPFGSGPKEGLLYRLVNDPPSLDRLPEEIRPLVASCLAKLPGDRPTALEALAEVGAIQPARGWLSESIIYGSAADELADQPDSPTENLFRFAGSFAGPAAVAGIAVAAAAGSAGGRLGGRRGRGGQRGSACPPSSLPAAGIGMYHRRARRGLCRGCLRPDWRQPQGAGSAGSAGSAAGQSGAEHTDVGIARIGDPEGVAIKDFVRTSPQCLPDPFAVGVPDDAPGWDRAADQVSFTGRVSFAEQGP